MRRDHVDALLDFEARRIGIDYERRNTLGRGCPVRAPLSGSGPCEHTIEVGDAAVRDPGFGAVQHVVLAVAPRRALHGGDIRTRLWLGQSERGDRATCSDRWQVAR